MMELQARILPRLVLDAVSCLWLAHDEVQDELKHRTLNAITWLSQSDLTNTDCAVGLLRDAAIHLRTLESDLRARDRPLLASRIRTVVERVHHVAP